MEEAKFLEKHEILPTDKMKSASSLDKIKESVSLESPDSKDSPTLNHDEIPKSDERIPNAKQNLEVEEALEESVKESKASLGEKPISEAIPSLNSLQKDSRKLDEEEAIKDVSEAKEEPVLNNEISLTQTSATKVNETVSDNTLKMETESTAIKEVSEAKEDSILSNDISLTSAPRERIPNPKVNEIVSDNTLQKMDAESTAFKEVSEDKEDSILSNDISLTSAPRKRIPNPKINETVSDNTLKMEAESTAIQQEEPNPLENPPDKCLNSQTGAEGLYGTKKPPVAKEEKSEQDHQMTAETSKAAVQDQKKQPKEAQLSAAKRLIIKEEKMKKDMQEYIDGIQAMEEKKRISNRLEAKEADAILMEEERRKNWKTLLSEVSQATSLSTFNSSFERSSTPRSVVVAILQRSAKQQYKRKMTILRENFTYRLGLLKQLKHDIKNNYRSEAQQLYLEYTSIKQKTQNAPRNIDTTDIHVDIQESKVIVTSENPQDLATLG